MNSNDLFDMIGETPEKYVQDAANVSNGNKEDHPYKRPSRIAKILLIAALIGLLTATVATAAERLRIWIKHEESFTNAATEASSISGSEMDGSKSGIIEFNINIEEEINGEPVPVLEVVPYFLTEEDVKRVAYVLFPDGEFHEGEPALEAKYSKDELQEKIDRWSQYSEQSLLWNSGT